MALWEDSWDVADEYGAAARKKRLEDEEAERLKRWEEGERARQKALQDEINKKATTVGTSSSFMVTADWPYGNKVTVTPTEAERFQIKETPVDRAAQADLAKTLDGIAKAKVLTPDDKEELMRKLTKVAIQLGASEDEIRERIVGKPEVQNVEDWQRPRPPILPEESK